jgi:hypothetical protein
MITITISPQTGDQIRIIAAAMIELLNTPPAEVATAETPFTSPTPAATEPAKTRKKTATPAATEQPAPAATEQPAPAATEQPAPAAPTLEEVRAKLTVFKDSGKSLKDLLATVDSPHLIAVPPERYSELLANMEKM